MGEAARVGVVMVEAVTAASGLVPIGEAVEVGLIYTREEVAKRCRMGVGLKSRVQEYEGGGR
eukprot:scaffold6551_cov118-Isochrysis_galbana.AAC.3